MTRTSRDVLLAKARPRRTRKRRGRSSRGEPAGPRRPHPAPARRRVVLLLAAAWRFLAGLWPGSRARKRVTILFVAANHPAGESLALDREYRAIEQSIRAARHRRAFRLVPKLAARLSDLREALLDLRPEVVHIACHGSPDAELLLLSEEAGTAPVPPTALASLFGALADNLTLVACNACFTAEQGEAIRRTAGLAISMRARIGDDAAVAFASSLYSTLAFGRSVHDAFEAGRAAVEVIDARQKETPRLFARDGLDARATYLVDPRPRPRPPCWKYGALGVCCFVASVWAYVPGLIDPPPPACATAAASVTASPSPVRGMVRFSGPCLRIGAFDLDDREVTNLEVADWLNEHTDAWQAAPDGALRCRKAPAIVLGRGGAECGGALTVGEDGRVRVDPQAADRPASCITWYGASEYCRARGKRLPLDAEWELAARGPHGRPYPWGTREPRQDGVTFGLRDSAAAHPRDVGTSPQDISPDRVHDLAGNVSEWVEDDRDGGGVETIRGGSWASRGAAGVLGTVRKRAPADTAGPEIGVRCASSVIDPGPGDEDGP